MGAWENEALNQRTSDGSSTLDLLTSMHCANCSHLGIRSSRMLLISLPWRPLNQWNRCSQEDRCGEARESIQLAAKSPIASSTDFEGSWQWRRKLVGASVIGHWEMLIPSRTSEKHPDVAIR